MYRLPPRLPPLPLVLLPALLLAGCAGIGGSAPDDAAPDDGAPPAEPPAYSEYVLEPARSRENNARVQAAKTIHWDWYIEEEVAVEFDIHRHDGPNVEYPYRVEAAADVGQLRVEATDEYSAMWYNNSTGTVTLWYRTWIG